MEEIYAGLSDGSYNWTLGRVDNMNTFLRMLQGGTSVSFFNDEKSEHRNTMFNCLGSHIFLWNIILHSQERMCLLNPMPASLTRICCSLQQWWEEIQEQGRKKKKKSYGKVNWGHTLVPDYTRSHWLFFLFSAAVCVPTAAKAHWLSWSTGECQFQGNLWSRQTSRCICLEGCPAHKSRPTPAEFVQSQSGYQWLV